MIAPVIQEILPQILGSLLGKFRRVVTHHPPPPPPPKLDLARLSACTRLRGPREAALLARRRAQPARRRREVVAQLRRRSRVGFAPCDPVPALRSSVVEAAAPRSSWSAGSSADLVARSKRAVSRRAEPLQRARWPASTRQQCLLADPLARHSTECAGCYQACLSPCAGCTALTDTSLAASFSRRGGLASVARERESD